MGTLFVDAAGALGDFYAAGCNDTCFLATVIYRPARYRLSMFNPTGLLTLLVLEEVLMDINNNENNIKAPQLWVHLNRSTDYNQYRIDSGEYCDSELY